MSNHKPLSREFLLKRGYCCGNGCKNCPYNDSESSEKLSKQLSQKTKGNTSKLKNNRLESK